MAEIENLADISIMEGSVTVPKASFIRKDQNLIQLKTNHYKDVVILKSLGKAKFPVFLATYKGDASRTYAMKVFPIEEPAQKYFRNEVRFTSLKHPHIVQTILVEENKNVLYKGALKNTSFILMENATYGDLFKFSAQYQGLLTEKLVRTYFHQLISGLEHLHQKGIAHLDLKLDNLLVTQDFHIKITDFDLACFFTDPEVLTIGTQYYRAPELKESKCTDYAAADIYSAAIILFVLMSGGTVPHTENVECGSLNLFDMLNNNNRMFWELHCKIQNKDPSFYSPNFKFLFNGMTKVNPKERLTIAEIKKSEWFNGPILNDVELKEFFMGLQKEDVGSC